MRHIRFHGRGGTGVKLASRIVGRAGFLAGLHVQDSPVYGAERRGAPIVAFTRLSDRPILERGYIEAPDALVVMDDSLFAHPEAAVLGGVDEGTLVLVNSRETAAALKARYALAGPVVAHDLSAIALTFLGQHLPSAPAAGLTVKAIGVAPWEILARAIRIELGELGLAGDDVERNLNAARCAFDAAPALDLPARTGRPPAAAPVPPFVLPRLPARIAAPSIRAEATSALRTTEGWRVYRPLIDLARCTRCFLCFALCPEGAIRLDAESWPIVDYDHCKGCLVCVHECPTDAIREVREDAP